ncbi:MAG: hypothetical protein NTY15_14735 [Planctomycetota bacterium]|nr:hypothetical protein [Planctomycetota bacterium]
MLAIGDLRIVNYNVRGFDGTPSTDVGTVLSAIGSEVYGGRVRPLDLIAIQEVQTQATTTQSVVSQLNAIYGAGRYSRGNLNGASLSGNETIGLIYNTQTVQLLSEAGIGTPSSAAAARQPIRYKLRPLEVPLGNDFYLYNSHYKASDTSSDRSRRNAEAIAIRTDADSLGSANIIYAGDFNLKSSTEASYQTLLATGAGQGVDPINRPGNWNGSSSFRDIFTQAPAFNAPTGFVGGGINDRFDFQLLTSEWLDGVGLEFAPGSYRTFGNNGTVAVNGSINDPSNTALPGFANRTALLNLLTTVTDHLPLVVDYYFASNLPPTNLSISASTISETASSGTIVGTLSSVDPNASDSHTYSLVTGTGSTNNSSFTIVGNTLRSSSSFSLDGTANYSVRIRTTDSGGLSFEKAITVLVTNTPPTLSRAVASVTGNVGATLSNNGTYADISSDTVTLTASVGNVAKNANGTWTWTLVPTASIASQTVTITGSDEDGGSSQVTFVLSAKSTVATRGLFYRGASGSSAASSLSDKVALMPGQASTFANYSSYSFGLNGLVVDVVGLPPSTTASQLLSSLGFAQWDGIAAAGFVALPGSAVPSVTIASGAGVGGATRVAITFPDNAIQNTWLQVTVFANANTGLSANDLFYFGNVIGDVNVDNTTSRLRVNAADTGAVRNNQSTLPNSADVTNIYDINRDGRVNATDTGIVRTNQQTLGIVAPIVAPAARTAKSSGSSSSLVAIRGVDAAPILGWAVGGQSTGTDSKPGCYVSLVGYNLFTKEQKQSVCLFEGNSSESEAIAIGANAGGNKVPPKWESIDEFFTSLSEQDFTGQVTTDFLPLLR